MSIQFINTKKQVICTVSCYRDLNILAHAQLDEVEIGSRCGGHGICGGDKIKIAAQLYNISPVTSLELKHLSPLEIKEGWRLACQCWPNTNTCNLIIHVE